MARARSALDRTAASSRPPPPPRLWQRAADGYGRIVDGDRSILGMVVDWQGA